MTEEGTYVTINGERYFHPEPHPQVLIESPIGTEIAVDEGLAFMLGLLWEEGFVTNWSCQGGENRPPYIMFPFGEDAERFVEEYGGTLDAQLYKDGARVVRGFDILSCKHITYPRVLDTKN